MLSRLGVLPTTTIRRAPLAFRIRSQPTKLSLHTSSSASAGKPRQTLSALPALSQVPPGCRHKFPYHVLGAVRGVASSVTNRPGSQTPGHAALNIKEEVGNTAGSVARGIAGANVTVDSVKPMKPEEDSFVSSPGLLLCSLRAGPNKARSMLILWFR